MRLSPVAAAPAAGVTTTGSASAMVTGILYVTKVFDLSVNGLHGWDFRR